MADISVMEEKWRNFFNLLDIDKDGKLSSKDRDSCKEAFAKLPSVDADATRNDLDLFWSKVMFLDGAPDWTTEITEDDFVKGLTDAFKADKNKLSGTIKSALTHLMNAADLNKDGVFTFDKFFQFHVGFNLPIAIVVKTTFNFIGPKADGTCSFDQVYGFYVELFIGEDVAKFEDFKSAYRAIGLL